MNTVKNVSVVSNTTNAAGLVTVVLTDGQTTVKCEDMAFFEDEDLESTFYEWIDLAEVQDTGCTLVLTVQQYYCIATVA